LPVMQLAVREDGLSESLDESHRDGI
jgi:hypothetical protein